MAHNPFTAASESEQREMLESIGATSFDDLFAHVPADLQTTDFDLPDGLSELETVQYFRRCSAVNADNYSNFCGAGFYDHYIPAAVDALSSRGEFYTPYTPYQPEASQGTLQAIYEYQTAIARLTEMEAANASLYDGGTALFEGMMMALRITRRNRVLVDEGVNPIYRTMLHCYTQNLDIGYREIPMKDGLADREAFAEELSSGDIGAVVLQTPNFFGCLEDLGGLIDAAHAAGALTVVSTYPLALGIIKTPGAMGADIVTGEGQSLGLPLSFGGPYLGFMATRKKHVRKMPGRIAGATKDGRGRRGYVLTLQAREQHIRREKATSNICTNEALCALRAVIYMSLQGKRGMVETAAQCARQAAYAHKRLAAMELVKPAFKHPFFNEFAIELPCPATDVISRLLHKQIAAGFPVGRYYKDGENLLLLAFTEKHTRQEIDHLLDELEKSV